MLSQIPNAVQSSGSIEDQAEARTSARCGGSAREVARMRLGCPPSALAADPGTGAREHRIQHRVYRICRVRAAWRTDSIAPASRAPPRSAPARPDRILVRTRRSATATCLTPSRILRQMQRRVHGVHGGDHVAELESDAASPARQQRVEYRRQDRQARWSRSRPDRTPESRRARAGSSSERNADLRSSRMLQQMHPLCSSTTDSSTCSHQQMVQPDFAELVDQHGGALHAAVSAADAAAASSCRCRETR